MVDSSCPVLEVVAPIEAEEIEAMARTIWPLVYSEMISTSQIEYMLDSIYSPDRIRTEIQESGISYFWIMGDGERIGFLAGGPRESGPENELHKIYTHPSCHGSGMAGRGLEAYFEHVRQGGGNQIHLRANRENGRALSFYQKHGFTIAGEDKASIGDGFYMDDFLLSKKL